MANFSFLTEHPEYELFAGACLSAEQALATSKVACAQRCRAALELAVHWVFAAEETFEEPKPLEGEAFAGLQRYLQEPHFEAALVGSLKTRLQYIDHLGEQAGLMGAALTRSQAVEALGNLFIFVQWLECSYGEQYQARTFNEALLPETQERRRTPAFKGPSRMAQKRLLKGLRGSSGVYTAARKRHVTERGTFVPEHAREALTRAAYIDLDLRQAGWLLEGAQATVVQEREITIHSQGKVKQGFADYVLLGPDGSPYAVVEAKRCGRDPEDGKTQAKLYADGLERETGHRPVIFLTNGFKTLFWDKRQGPPREVSGIFGQADLQRLLNREAPRQLMQININPAITDRYYQTEAIRAVCSAIEKGQRKHLLVMATGTGKTRTTVSLVDVLSRGGQLTNVLFLADRIALVDQAMKAFQKHLPSFSCCNLMENRETAGTARIVFSTYQTMQNAIDSVVDASTGGRVFTPAHFDLIVVDEGHRSIFNKYHAIFDYFDGQLVGLTATPKDEVTRSTYKVFGQESKKPTYAYDYRTALEDGVLVPYWNYDVGTKFLTEGIKYKDLSEDEKRRYEEAFSEEGEVPDEILPGKMLAKVIPDKTIDLMLAELMRNGIYVDGGERLGKTVIFAQTQQLAKRIEKRFDALYPEYHGLFASCVVCSDSHVQDVIARFRQDKPEPQIAISVDMMDTGIDVPEIVNLVFFKRVHSKVKFWQMIGRGTRLCPNLRCKEGEKEYLGKRHFIIFDYCENFEFFEEATEEMEGDEPIRSLTERIFSARVQVMQRLQEPAYQEEPYRSWRSELVAQVRSQVESLSPARFDAKPHAKAIAHFKREGAFNFLSEEDVRLLNKEVAPLVRPEEGDDFVKRFDLLMFDILAGKMDGTASMQGARIILTQLAQRLEQKRSIPAVDRKKKRLAEIQGESFWRNPSAYDLEIVRRDLRDLMVYLNDGTATERTVIIDLMDVIMWRTAGNRTNEPNDEMAINVYKEQVEAFIREHRDDIPAISKLWKNQPLTEVDFRELQRILVLEFEGGETAYAEAYHDKSLGLLVREIVGLNPQAAEAAFASFTNTHHLTTEQSTFLRRIIHHIVKHGYIEDEVKTLSNEPFNYPTSFDVLFREDVDQDFLLNILRSIHNNALIPQA